MTIKINNLAIGGYRSFGSIQHFENFEKINLFIGRNNSGKSNILRLINTIYSSIGTTKKYIGDPLDVHRPNHFKFLIGISPNLIIENDDRTLQGIKGIFKNTEHHRLLDIHYQTIQKIFLKKCETQDSKKCWTYIAIPSLEAENDSWLPAINSISDGELYELWRALNISSGGSRVADWQPGVIKKLQEKFKNPQKTHFIPAIRQIASTVDENADGYDGAGIIKKLAVLQNPDVHNQELRKKFSEINNFVQSVLDRSDATIEIPYDRSTILVHMDNKVLPLESLGTGVHEVIILAAAATTLNDTVLCIEEPELHLNPILQRKLLNYLSQKTSNQYFITTHSPAIMDTFGAEIYHITQSDGESKVVRASSDRMKSDACEDLGYHPSDLLQTNCVIWVEGPSDRVYIKYWLTYKAPEFSEGIHYSIMFYGGRLLSHLSGEENESALDEFISLRKLNKRGVIVIDSDKSTAHTHLNKTKKRLIKEFDKGPGFSWVTSGREIENYLSEKQLKFGIKSSSPRCSFNSTFGKYENCLKIKGERGTDTQASKTDVAHSITKEFEPNLEIYDLKEKINKLIQFIKESNPATKV